MQEVLPGDRRRSARIIVFDLGLIFERVELKPETFAQVLAEVARRGCAGAAQRSFAGDALRGAQANGDRGATLSGSGLGGKAFVAPLPAGGPDVTGPLAGPVYLETWLPYCCV